MEKTVILRFRDLVTEEGGTIRDHASLLEKYGEVWWGWWMRPYEIPPRPLFQELSNRIQKQGGLIGYLFDTGSTRLYSAHISRILMAPLENGIPTPEPERSPSYYHRGRYPAWFLLRSLKEVNFLDLKFIYDSFPTMPELQGTLAQLQGKRVSSLEQMRQIDVTLWVVQTEQ